MPRGQDRRGERGEQRDDQGQTLRLLIDNVEIDAAGWECEANCFANDPQPKLSGLGWLEIKPESLRYVICAQPDLLEESGFNIERWILEKVQRGFRDRISEAIMCGDGIGKPMGLLNPQSGIPICEMSPSSSRGSSVGRTWSRWPTRCRCNGTATPVAPPPN